MSDKTLDKKDFEALKKLRFQGKMCDGVDAELYWINCTDSEDAVFSQTIRKHSHDFFEIHFVLSGKITYSSDGGRLPVRSSELLIIPDSAPHTIEGYSADMLKVSAALKISGDEPLYHALRENGFKIIQIDSASADIIKYCAETAKKGNPYKEALIKNRVFELLTHISGDIDFSARKEIKGAPESDVRLFKAKQFIKDNPNVFVGCKELALYCNVSPKQLNRIFIKYEGIPLLKYIHSEKLTQAKEMLIAKKGTLAEISENLGFSSVYYFSKFFTDREGCSPGAFKKANGK